MNLNNLNQIRKEMNEPLNKIRKKINKDTKDEVENAKDIRR